MSPYRGRGGFVYPAFGGWLGPGLLDFTGDTAAYDAAVSPTAPPAGENSDAQGGDLYGPAGPPPGTGGTYENEPGVDRETQMPAVEDWVTLVFRDGRPPEQIHNYLLTRTTLYVQDGRRREISVEQLDLAATQRANHDAGVEFRLPDSPR